MTAVYLWFNAALYFVFAVLCTVKVDKTTVSQGFLSLDANGRCEYLTVYGGMEFGFAAFFALCALKSEYRSAGILFALCMYAGIVAYRTVCLLTLADLSTTTKSIAGLEIALLICGALIFFKVIE